MTTAECRNLVLSVCDVKQTGVLPEPCVGAQLVACGNVCFLCGGVKEKDICSKSYILDIARTSWQETECDIPALWGHSALNRGGDILVFGGVTADKSISATLYVIDTSTENWSVLASKSPLSRCFHAASLGYGQFANFLFVYGGFDGMKISAELWIFDIDGMFWAKCDEHNGQSPGARFGHTLTTSEEALFLVGGDVQEECIIYRLTVEHEEQNMRWIANWQKISSRSAPPSGRIFHTCIMMRPKWLFMFGGLAHGELCAPYIFDFAKERWSRPIAEGNLALSGQAATQVADKLLAFSGGYLVRESYGRDLAGMIRQGYSEQTGGGSFKQGVDLLPAIQESGNQLPRIVKELLLTVNTRLSRKLIYSTVLELRGQPAENSQLKFKIVTVGDTGVGKSCLLTRFVSDSYRATHAATIGADFSSIVTVIKGKLCSLQLWDTAGQERFANMTAGYFRDADGFVIVFDLTRRITFEHVNDWIDLIREFHPIGPECGVLLVGNKCDLEARAVSNEEGRKLALRLGATYLETSAKTAENVDLAFMDLASVVVERRLKSAPKPLKGNAVLGEWEDKSERNCCGFGF